MNTKKSVIFILLIVVAVSAAVATYTFMRRSSMDNGLMEKLCVDDMTYSKTYGWIFAEFENYNGEFVLYIEGLHRLVFASPAQYKAEVLSKPDISIRMTRELLIYGDVLIYDGNQYTIKEYGGYTLPLWASENLLSGNIKAFTSLGTELSGVGYEVFPILSAISLYRVSPITLSPYANYFIDVIECRVCDNTVEYIVSGGERVVFRADTMEYDYSTDSVIDRAYREGEPKHIEDGNGI